MNTIPHADWFRVADMATSKASHSIPYGVVLSWQSSATFISCYSKELNALNAQVSTRKSLPWWKVGYHPKTGPLALWVKCSPMVRDTGVQSQVESYQRLKKWYLMLPCLALSIIRWGLSNPGNGVAPSPTPRCSSYWKGSHRATLD